MDNLRIKENEDEGEQEKVKENKYSESLKLVKILVYYHLWLTMRSFETGDNVSLAVTLKGIISSVGGHLAHGNVWLCQENSGVSERKIFMCHDLSL